MSSTAQVIAGASRRAALSDLRRASVPALLLPCLGVIFLALAWQVVAATDVLGTSIPQLSEVLEALRDHAEILRRAASATATSAVTGGLIGYALGVALAAVTAWFPRTQSSVIRIVVLVNAVPVVALGPVLMSLSVRAHIPEIFAAMAVLFSTTGTVSDGLRSESPSSADLFRVYGASAWTRFWRLQLPTAAPWAADAFRLAVPAAILGAILGEWFGADRGLGVVMVSSMRNLQYGLLWAAGLVAVLVSVFGYVAGTVLERQAAKKFERSTQAARQTEPPPLVISAAIAVAIPVLVLLAWHFWIVAADVPPIVAPAPDGVWSALVEQPGEYLSAAGLTALSAFGGLVSGAAFGVGLAVVVAFTPFVRSMLSPLALVIPTVPIVVFIPVLGSIFGYGMTTVLAACVLMAFFPVYVLMLSGLAARPRGSDDLFSVYGASRLQRMMRLAVPASVPSLMLAVRLSAANCILIAISAEWLMGQGGLGRVFSEKRVFLDLNGAWAAVLVSIAMSLVAYILAAALEKKVTRRWQ